jgi:hypothetical protein
VLYDYEGAYLRKDKRKWIKGNGKKEGQERRDKEGRKVKEGREGRKRRKEEKEGKKKETRKGNKKKGRTGKKGHDQSEIQRKVKKKTGVLELLGAIVLVVGRVCSMP